MFYDDQLIDEVRNANDIVSVVSSYINLKKSGSNYLGICPFHSDSNPSLSVSPSKQIYKCFACGAGGNVISFVMDFEGFTFAETIEVLADRAGINLPQNSGSSKDREKEELRKGILNANKEAGKYYFYSLINSRDKRALNYFLGRGLKEETIKSFGLGYARSGGKNLYEHLKKNGFSDELLKKSGLFNFDEKRGLTDKFWNRVIFPIMDKKNRIIAFGGRVFGDGKPKYINSPETEVYDKSRNLFGLNFAKNSKEDFLILCEGYMDVIMLHQAGFKQAVASCGTALTQAQARLMGHYAHTLYISYDSDEPGVKAALRALEIIRDSGLSGKVIDLKPYKDPDELIKGLGTEEYKKRIATAVSGFEFEIKNTEEAYDLNDPESKTSFFKEVAGKLLRFKDNLERDSYIESVSREYMINPEDLKELVKKQAIVREGIKLHERPKPLRAKREQDEKTGASYAEIKLLGVLASEPALFNTVKKYVSKECFTEGFFRDFAGAFFSQLSEGKLEPAALVDISTEEKDRQMIASVLEDDSFNDADQKDKDKYLKELILFVRMSDIDHVASSGESSLKTTQCLIEKKRKLEELKAEFSRTVLWQKGKD